MSAIIADPIAALLRECARYSRVRERLVGTTPTNRSIEIDYWLTQVNIAVGQPWCAAYISQVGIQALGAAWPVKRDALVQNIVDDCLARGLVLETVPEVGDIMVIYYAALGRHGHIGIVEKVIDSSHIKTWEGNTNIDGSRDGNGVYNALRRTGTRHKFLRWINLLNAKSPA